MSTWEEDSAKHNHSDDNWELESPDGTVKVNRDQLCKAHWLYDQIRWDMEPYKSALKLHPSIVETGAMAGCIGVSMGLEREVTAAMWDNPYFRDLVESQLLARQLHRAMDAGLS